MSVAFDVSINGMYLICDYHTNTLRTQFVILKKSFDNRISQIIYRGRTGMFGIDSMMLLSFDWTLVSVICS